MKRPTKDFLFILIGLFASIGTLWASTLSVETRLARDVAYLNSLGRNPASGKSLTLFLESRFKADPVRINEMRRAELGFGDISVTYAVASGMRGGATKGNVERIASLRQSARFKGWGVVARSFGVRLEKIVLMIESLHARPAHAQSAKAEAAKAPAASKGPGYDPVLRLVHGG